MMPHDRRRAAGPAAGTFTRLLAFLDYDGTITTHECNEIVLQSLVGDAWRPFEDEVRARRMGHAECFDSQIRLVRAPRRAFLDSLVAAAQPQPGLRGFLAEVARRDGQAVVASAGFREAIQAFWRREALAPVDVHASELISDGPDDGPDHEGPYHIGFNPQLSDCPRCGPSCCKAGILRAVRRPGDFVMVFGDGDSDLCPAREADITFARGWLAECCAAEDLPWRPLDFEAARDMAASLPLVEQELA